MKTKRYTNREITASIMLLALTGACVGLQAQVERPHHGGSTVVMASQYPTWKNAAGIYFADNNFASVVLDRGKVSDTLEIGNFNFKVPADAIIEGVTVTIYKGATGKGISDNMVSLVLFVVPIMPMEKNGHRLQNRLFMEAIVMTGMPA